MKKILSFVMIAVVLLFCNACRQFPGETQPITKEISVQRAENPDAGIVSLPDTPVTVYTEAVMDFLSPLEDYSWERKYDPEFVMIHFTSAVVEHREDPYGEANVRELFTEGSEISIHYLIQRDGTVYCYLPEDRVAWHAGYGTFGDDPKYDDNMNHYAIGIELAAIGSAADMEKYLPEESYLTLDPSLIGFTEEQYDALSRLVEDLCSRYDIPCDEAHIIGHNAYSPDKTDPGELFDWNRVLKTGN